MRCDCGPWTSNWQSLVATTPRTDRREKKESKVDGCVPLATAFAAWGHSIVANKGVDDWNHFPARQMRPSASFFTAARTSAYWLSCDDQLILLRRTTWCAHNALGCDVNWRPNTSRADQSTFLLPSHGGLDRISSLNFSHKHPLDATGGGRGRAATEVSNLVLQYLVPDKMSRNW